MKEMDCVEVIVEKEEYAEEGVHKGMQGWICYDVFCDGTWLVNFPQCGEKDDIATLSIREGRYEACSGNERYFKRTDKSQARRGGRDGGGSGRI